MSQYTKLDQKIKKGRPSGKSLSKVKGKQLGTAYSAVVVWSTPPKRRFTNRTVNQFSIVLFILNRLLIDSIDYFLNIILRN